jgi:uncharacterized DUF497 family protein
MLYVIWDLENDPNGNVQHIGEHGVSCEEVEDIFRSPEANGFSSTSGRPILWGYTWEGRYLKVVFEWVDEDAVYPVTAYEVAEPS